MKTKRKSRREIVLEDLRTKLAGAEETARVSQEANEGLRTELNELEDERDSLRTELDTEKEEKRGREGRVTDLERENADLLSKNETLRATCSGLMDTIREVAGIESSD